MLGATAAAGGAIAAAVAATGRGASVGDRGRGCRRRSGWVRPGPGRAGPLPLSRLPGLCVGPGGREQRRRPRPDRRDAPVGPGARGGAWRRASGSAWQPCRTCLTGQRRAAARKLPAPRFPAPRGWPSSRRGQLQNCQRFP